MLRYELLQEESILIVAPEDPLEVEDFVALNREVDPYIAETGMLKGLMIYSESFPGWVHIPVSSDHRFHCKVDHLFQSKLDQSFLRKLDH